MKKEIIEKIKLGDKVRCIYTGFEGTVVAKTEFINGCVQCNILPKQKEKGVMPEEIGIDEGSLELIKQRKIKRKKKGVGGSMKRNLIRRNF